MQEKPGRKMYNAFLQRIQYVKKNGNTSTLVRSTLEYIETHILEKIRLEKMASEIGYNYYYLSRKFKEETGTSIAKTINRRKVEVAKQMLRQGHLSISSLSEMLSFSSPSHFYSVFKKFVGISPQEYSKHPEEEQEEDPN